MKHRHFLSVLNAFFIAVILLWPTGGFAQNAEQNAKQNLAQNNSQPNIGTGDIKKPPAKKNAGSDELYKQLALFGDVLQRVREEYVDAPENKELIEAALTGMLASLDPHSAYLPPDGFDDMQVQTKGEFGGLGIEVTMEHGLVKVIAPIDDTPAQRAGLLPNDYIVRLNGEDVQGKSLSEAVDIMRGEVGTDITISVLRKNVDEPFDVTIKRAIIKIQAVRWRVEESHKAKIGYIRLTTFNRNTTKNLHKALAELSKEIKPNQFAGWLIDLRNNPGGLLSEAITVADTFLSQGEIVSTRARREKNNARFNARRGDIAKGGIIMVLINGGSASASEIVAGALQDHHRALIVGMRSFGKGSVQSVMPLNNEGALRLTTARYYTPSGRSIQATGIEPDIIIPQSIPERMQNLLSRREATLPGHLENEKNEKNKRNKKNEKNKSAGERQNKIDDGSGEKNDEKNNKQAEDIPYVPRELEDDTQLQAAIKLMGDLHKTRGQLSKLARKTR